MSDRPVTSQDVAAMAGVSQSAVSRVFTPGASASKETARKVRDAAQKLGYRPNVLARSLVSGRSRIIGLVVAYLENQFYPDALERLSTALQERGYHILVFMASGRGDGVSDVIDELLDYQVDGIITASVGLSDDLTRRCSEAGIPVVLFNRGQADARLSQVTSANRAGGQQVAEFLLAGGHHRLAHISGWSGSSTGADRAEGFLGGLRAQGVDPVAVVDGMYQRDAAAEAASTIVRTHGADAFFVGNDHMAFGVIDALRHDLGLRVPEDVSVVGYDDVAVAAWPSYDLTTVRQPSARMVERTVELLMNRIDEPSMAAEKVEIDGSLIVRGSARVPGGWT